MTKAIRSVHESAIPYAVRLGLVAAVLAGFGAPRYADAVEPADAVYRGGRIYTVDAGRSWAEAVAIRGGRFVAVGSDADIASHVGPKTRIVELAGRMLMPGIHDLHAHPVQAGFQHLYECSFPFTTPLAEVVAKVRSCAANSRKGHWIIGGQWAAETLESDRPPTLRMLDDAAPQNPVFLIDSTYHNAWVNSAALAALAIDAKTPDPAGGVIVRDAKTGAPAGLLFDSAAYSAMKRLPRRSEAEYEHAIEWAVATMNALGITGMKDALADGYSVAAYVALDRAGKLNMRVGTCRPWRATWSSDTREEHNLEHWREDETARVRTGFAKIFVDGIPPTRTAALLEPYLPDAKHGADFRGNLQHSKEDLDAALVRLDRLGLTVKMHATGDASVRAALDAIEAARKANKNRDLRHEVAHAELIHPDDLPRFAALNAVAELSPILWYRSPLVEVMAAAIGPKRADRLWPIRSLLEDGTTMIYGSDWPSVVPSASPWPGIEAMVTRRDPYAVASRALAPEQAISRADAIEIVTRNGAAGLRLEHETGSIEVGRSADFIVLDRNLFQIPAEEIGDTRVLETVLEGRTVYAARPN